MRFSTSLRSGFRRPPDLQPHAGFSASGGATSREIGPRPDLNPLIGSYLRLNYVRVTDSMLHTLRTKRVTRTHSGGTLP